MPGSGRAARLKEVGGRGDVYSHIPPGVSHESVRSQLDKILSSRIFARCERLGRFLRFTVDRTLHGEVEKVMSVAPLGPKFLAFNWHVLEVDGHDIQAIARALDDAARTEGRPTMIIARTVKGKGVPFFEHKASYHGVPPSDDELARALEHLGHA